MTRQRRPHRSIGARAGAVLRRAVSAFFDDRVASMGAAVATYTMFSLAPLLLIVVSLAGWLNGSVSGVDGVRGHLVAQVSAVAGADAAGVVESLMSDAASAGRGALATAIGLALALLGATAVFGELQESLDRILRTPLPASEPGWWSFLRSRVLSIGLIVSVAFLLVVSLVFGALVAAFNAWWAPFLGPAAGMAALLGEAVELLLLTALFGLVYRWLPRARLGWAESIGGAAVTALLFVVGNRLIALYLEHATVASAFGAAGSLVALIVWVYYSAQVILFGAELIDAWLIERDGDPPAWPRRP